MTSRSEAESCAAEDSQCARDCPNREKFESALVKTSLVSQVEASENKETQVSIHTRIHLLITRTLNYSHSRLSMSRRTATANGSPEEKPIADQKAGEDRGLATPDAV
jgi:hypothetical protein